MFKGKSKLADFLLLLAIKYIYIYVTVTQLSDLWYHGHSGYGIIFDISREILASAVFIIMTVLVLNVKTDKLFIKSFLLIIYVLYYIPMNSAYAMHSMDLSFFIWSTVFVFLIIMAFYINSGAKISLRDRTNTFPNEARLTVNAKNLLSNRTVHIFCFIVCSLYIIYKLSYNGFSFSLSISGDSVYEVRDEFTEHLASMDGTVIAYIIQIVRNLAAVVVPAYLYIGLSKKKYFAIGYSVLTLLCMFSVSSGKGSLFFALITVAIYILEKKDLLKNFSRVFLVGILALFIISLLEIMAFGKSWIYSIILRREMFLPSWLNTMYFDCFIDSPKYWWSESAFLLQRIIPSAYSVTPIKLINDAYFNGLVPSPNTGLFAEAIMQAGILGVFIYPVIYKFLIKRSANVYGRFGEGFSVLFAARMAISMTNVPILRTDFVLSFILLTVILAILPRISVTKS